MRLVLALSFCELLPIVRSGLGLAVGFPFSLPRLAFREFILDLGFICPSSLEFFINVFHNVESLLNNIGQSIACRSWIVVVVAVGVVDRIWQRRSVRGGGSSRGGNLWSLLSLKQVKRQCGIFMALDCWRRRGKARVGGAVVAERQPRRRGRLHGGEILCY